MENGIIYARFSSQSQNEQSIEAQIRICSEFAENKGINIVNVYSDKAKTGTNTDRPAFQKMVSDAQTGAFKYIIVYMFDRFARNRRDSVMYKEMLKEKYGIKVISALEPISEDEGGEFYEMFLEWNAEKYSKRLSKRIRDGIDTSIANGMFCGGKVPFGYRLEIEQTADNAKPIKKVVVYEEEAEIIRFIFTQYNLESYVTSCVVNFLKDKKNAEMAVDEVFAYYEKRTDEDNLRSISARIANIQSEAEKLADAFIDAKSQLLKNKIETKMAEYEILLSDLETQKAQLELERGYRITKKDLLAFIEELLKGDVNDKEYQKQIINHLVSQVFVSDDDTVVFFNLRGGKDIEKLTIDDTKEAVNSAKGVRTQTSPLHHR